MHGIQARHNDRFLFFLKNLGLPVNKILDMSAGRGARLVAAAAFSKIIDDSITYIGVDPNDCLHKNYGKMAKYITEYLKLDKFNYKIFNDGFEKIDPKKLGEGFDVMFTSPPYFDLEVYVKGPGEDKQSITGKNSQQWIDDFMIVSMRKIADLLKSGGIMAINIEDSATGATNFIPRLLSGAESIKSLRFAGNIAYARNKPEKLKFHEIWLWQKK